MAVRIKKPIHKIKKHVAKHAQAVKKHTKDHFIPHAGNRHHPHVLRHHVLFGYTAILLLLKALTIGAAVTFPKVSINAIAITPANVLALTNQARAALNLQPLELNSKLASSAQAKAADMLKNQYFDHTSPDGLTPWYWIKSAGYRYLKSAENLAVHYTTAEGLQNSWMASPSHKKNILNPVFTESGVGIAYGFFEGVETTFVVQHFGQPVPVEEFVIPEIQPSSEKIDQTPPAANTSTQPEVVAKTLPTDNPPPPLQPTESLPVQTAATKPLPDPGIKNNQPATLPAPPTHTGQVAIADQAQINTTTPPEPIEEPAQIPVASITENPKATSSVLGALDQDTNQPKLIWAGSDAMPQYVFALNQPKAPQEKLFGLFTSEDVKNITGMFYVFFLVFLTLSLMLSIFIKFHIQNIKAISHTLGVIGLIIFLILT